jgi:hypothetical protein
MSAAKRTAVKAADPEPVEEIVADEPKPTPPAKAKPTDPVADNLAVADAQTLSGYPQVLQHLEVAFVHALAGAKKEALERLAAAEAEADRVAPALDHLKAQFALLKARVHAVLSHR